MGAHVLTGVLKGPVALRYGAGRLITALLMIGIAAHLAMALLPGKADFSALSGGGDTRAYVDLGHNLAAGKGFTYAGRPTAFRPPLYPLLLAGLMRVAPDHWPILVRLLQFAASLGIAWICWRLGTHWFGEFAGRVSGLVALYSPMLLFFAGEILTECLAALFISAAFYCMSRDSVSAAVLAGSLAGLAALTRFNAIPLLGIVPLAFWLRDRHFRRAAVAGAACALLLLPWVLHNWSVFGTPLYSTHGGFAAVEGVLMPLGRTQPGETGKLKAALGGWSLTEVETEQPVRPEHRDELALNAQAWDTARRLWAERGLSLLPIAGRKLAAYWLSTDQLLDLESVSPRGQLLRRLGVAFYWGLLGAACVGWWVLRKRQPWMAAVFLAYAVAMTALHLPLTMNTRLRVPLFEPLLAAAAGGVCLVFAQARKRSSSPESSKEQREQMEKVPVT